jgi:DNA adenine methylase
MKRNLRTPISYYGGKQALLSHILPLIPPHEVYTEVFFGGGAVFWAKQPAKNETINDRLDVVVNFYRVLKSDFKQLKKLIDASLISRTLNKEARQIINNSDSMDRLQVAWAFWINTNFAYSNKLNAGYKYTNDCFAAVPETLASKKAAFTQLLQKRIEHAYIENEDALKILHSRNIKNAFHYLDPPYPGSDQGHYSGYTWEDYEKLLQWCGEQCKGKFLLSNYHSELLESYIKKYGWKKKEITHRIKAPRKSGNGKAEKTEVLIYNYASPCGTLSIFDHKEKEVQCG